MTDAHREWIEERAGQILHEANSAGAASRGLWWWIMPPGIMIALTGLSFVLIGKTPCSLLKSGMITFLKA